MTHFSSTFIAQPGDIDELGHVNNAVWVRWVQDVGVAHWHASASPEHIAAYFWVIVRHEIDYRGNIGVGESVEARTWVGEMPKGAKFDRHVEFLQGSKVIVRATTTWAILDRASGRLIRVPKDVSARFRP